MAQKGDQFYSASKFGPVVQFDTAETQRTPSFSEDSYQGRILRNWGDALGSIPNTSVLAGLRVSGFGAPGLPPASGTTDASLLQYIRRIEIDLTGIKIDTAALTTQLAALAASVTAIAVSTQATATSTQAIAISNAAIATSTQAIAASAQATAISNAAIAVSSAATAASAAASAASAATIATQQAQIITLLTSINNKP